ncbi:alpha/beta-Hydrolases superfamily protein [Actinidia rufa]|uniref:Alpha/beta-Hydrolases superfamily protein n=1 Tax=Actinidia rufa TaxID=165716 RepID=A0A7J0E2Q7_9ERIC|nr:alpha/beta-Hydrolases superfamily protein [Actinidia rufa]
MIAPVKSLVGPTNLFPKPISNCQLSGAVVSFDQGFGPIQGLKQNKLLVCHRGEKREVIRKLSRGCFMDNRKKEKKVEVESVHGGEDIFDAEKNMSQAHLVIMVNGIVGSAADWRYAAEQFVKKLPDKVIVHRSECNYSKLTFDGVDRMGERLAGEVLDVVKRWPEVRKISFVAHSLGGLVARYAIGRLYELFPKMETTGLSGNCSSREHLNKLTQHPEKHFGARIAGLEPMNFVTFATPHLGSRGHRQLPFLCGLPFLERSAPQTAHLIVGRSGKHLFLTDNDEGKPPLLVQMVNDSNDVKFMSALRSFKRRVAYANANYDYVVGWRTSSIRRQHELPKSNLLVKDEKYPHVVYVERESTKKIHNGTSSMVGKQASDLEGM